MATESGITHPLSLLREPRGKKLLTMLFCMLVCMLGVHTGVLAFPPGVGLPPGVPDLNHPDTKLTVQKNNSVANNTDQNIVKVHIVDEFGVPVSGVDIVIVSSSGGFTPIYTTNASGDALVPFPSPNVGTVSIQAFVNGAPLIHGSPALTYFVAGPPTVNTPGTTLSVLTNNATANGTATNSVRAHITDAYGHPIANQTIAFTIASGTASFKTAQSGTTDANGNFDVELVSTIAGQVNLTATMNGNNIINGSPAIVTFVADAPQTSNPLTTLSVVTNNAVANGVATNSVQAHVVDANGNPVTNQSVQFFIFSGTATFVGSTTVNTNASGNAVIALNSIVAGNVRITASVNGVFIIYGSPVTVTFTAGPPDVNISSTGLLVITNNALANGTATNSVRARIRDANGNAVANATVVFSIISGTGTIVGSSTVTTDASGFATINITSLVTGNVSITATVNGVAIINGSPAVVRFVADVPNVANPATALSVVNDNALANGIATNRVKAHIVDANGNPVPNATIVFTIAGGSANFATPATTTTNSNGDAFVNLNSIVAGNVSITATVNGVAIVNGSPLVVKFVADAPAINNPATTLSVVTNNAIANGIATNSVKAHIVDAQGNPVANATIVFSIFSGTANFASPATVTTNASGDAIVTLTSTVVGAVRITATVNGVTILNGSPAIVNFIVDVPSISNPATALSVVTNNAAANGVATNSVLAHIVDASGHPVPNVTIVFTIVTGTASFASPATITTNANGDAVVTLNSTVAGQVTITATANGTPVTNGSPVTVTFVSDVPSVSNPGTKLVIDQNDAIANGTDQNSVTAWVVDANGNPVPNAFVIFTLSGGADFYNAPAGLTDADGKITLILTSLVAGWNDVNATVDGTSITNGAPAKVRFKADAPSTSNPATTITVGDNLRVADNVAKNTVIVHVVDANGNPVEGAEVNFSMEGGTAMAGATFDITGPVLTNADGDAIMPIRSSAVGTVEIKAKVGTSPVVNGEIPAIVTFVNDVPAINNPATTLSVEVTGATANGTALNKVKARIVDANGHPVPGATIDFDKLSGVADFDGPYTGLITDANGEVIVSLKSTVAGFVDVVATVNGTPIVNGSPARVEFVADAPSTGHNATALIVVVPEAIANGTATTSVKAHIADANGNPVKNADVDFSIFSGTGTIEQNNPVKTDENGDAIITIHSTVVGEVEITANVGGSPITNGSTAKVRFIAGNPAVGHAETALIVVVPEATADGVATTSVKAHVVDANGHIIPGVNVVFTIAAGTATIVETNPVTTDAAGDAIITLHSTVAGEVSITATINGVDIINGSPAKVRFKAGTPDPAHTATALIVVVDRAQANGTATNSVKAHVVDTYGNPVEGAEVVFTIANGTATINEANPIMTNANGDAIITLVSTVGGTVDITATVNGAAIVNGSPATVTFTTDPDIAHPDTRLIVVANDAIADGVETNSVKAHVVDATGTPLNLKEVFFKIESGDATVLTVQPVLTDVNGDATILLASKTAGGVTVTAKVGDKQIVNGSPAKLRFVPIDIYVPRVFTPNNDGQNDVAKPIVVGLTTFHYFNIYNRWGNLVFTTKDPNAGWDGRFKGVLQPVETYLWIAEGLDKDKKKITRRGMISLVR